MSNSSTKRGVAVRNFRDAGTGETFEGKKSYDFDAGRFTNYAAAGLVREPDGNEARATVAEPTITDAAQPAAPAESAKNSKSKS